jgi:hypothetical protein
MTGEERMADFARAHLARYFEYHAYNDDLDSSEGRERILEPIEMAAVETTPEWALLRHRVISLHNDLSRALQTVEVIDRLAHIFEHLSGEAWREFSMTLGVERLDHRPRSFG